MSHHLKWTTDFPESLSQCCSRNNIGYPDGLSIVLSSVEKPEAGLKVLPIFGSMRFIPVTMPSGKIEYVVYYWMQKRNAVLLVKVTDEDLLAEQKKLAFDPVMQFRLMRIAVRIAEWISNLPL